MTNRDDAVPPDQFERVLKEMRKLDILIGEVHEHVEVARGIRKFEAQRALDKASTRVEEAQYWIQRAISIARGKGSDDDT